MPDAVGAVDKVLPDDRTGYAHPLTSGLRQVLTLCLGKGLMGRAELPRA